MGALSVGAAASRCHSPSGCMQWDRKYKTYTHCQLLLLLSRLAVLVLERWWWSRSRKRGRGRGEEEEEEEEEEEREEETEYIRKCQTHLTTAKIAIIRITTEEQLNCREATMERVAQA